MLTDIEDNGRLILADMEAGHGALFRLASGKIDVLVVVAEPSAKGIDVARRAATLGSQRKARVIVVANRLRDQADLDAIQAALPEHKLVPVPEEPVIEHADREGVAPIDLDPGAPGVVALVGLAERIVGN